MISKNNMTASYHMSWNPKPTQNVQASIERRFAPNVINASLPRTASDAGQRKPQLLRKQSYINAINGVDQSSSDYIKHIRTHFSKSYSRRATTESLTTRLRDHQHEASSTSSYRSIDDCKVHSRRRSDPFVLKLKKLIATNSTSATSASFKVDQSMKTPTRRFASPSKATTLKEGHLCCKSVVIQNKRATDRSWRHGWVILRDTGCLYIYHASASALHLVHSPPVPQPSSVSTATYTDPMSGIPFPIVSKGSQCHVQLASDYKKRQRVFRLITNQGCELLLQAPDAQNLCEWLFEIRRACGGHLLPPVNPEITIDSSADQQSQLSSSITCCSLSPSSIVPNTSTFRLTSSTSTSSSSASSSSSKNKPTSHGTSSSSELQPDLLIASTPNIDNSSGDTNTRSSGKRLASSPIFLRRGVPACLRRSATVNNVELIRLMNPSNHLTAAGKAIVNSVKKSAGSNETKSSKNFGLPLVDCEFVPMNPRVPAVVVLLSKLIESCGIRNVGIYRQTGSVQTTSWMVGQLNKGIRNADFSDARWNDTKAIASTLKCFFSKLPECLFSKALYSELIKAGKITEHDLRLKSIKLLIRRLPQQSIHTLHFISRHFANVASMVEYNKVDVRNIAIIFGPTLLWHPDRTLQGNLTDNPEKVRIIESVVNYSAWMFDENVESGLGGTLDNLVPALPVTFTKTSGGRGDSQNTESAKINLSDGSAVDEEDTSNEEDEYARCSVEPIDVVQAVLGNVESDVPSGGGDYYMKRAPFVSDSSRM